VHPAGRVAYMSDMAAGQAKNNSKKIKVYKCCVEDKRMVQQAVFALHLLAHA